jgi:hypothetical protein
MQNLFYLLLAFALISISAQFYSDFEAKEIAAEIPKPNPLVIECREKVYNNTKVRDCVNTEDKYWATISDQEKSICCREWDLIKCFDKFASQVCTAQEIKEVEAYEKNYAMDFHSATCKDLPFGSAKCQH